MVSHTRSSASTASHRPSEGVFMKNKQIFRMAKKYCKDPIEKIPGYKEAMESDEVYVIHHILELTMDGDRANTVEDLIRMGMYYDRPYFELLFLPTREHSRLHNKGKNNFSFRTKDKEAARKKQSLSLTGHRGWNRGKTWSNETKEKMRQSHKGLKHSPESRMKIAELNRKRRDKFLEYKASGGSLSFNSWSSTLWHTVKEVA